MTQDSNLVLSSSFTFSGPFTIQDFTQTIDTVDTTTSTTISGAVGGGGLLRKSGAGTLILVSPTNSYTGGTRIDEGKFVAFTDANLGAASGGLAFDGGTLSIFDGFTTSRAVTFDEGGGTIEALRAHSTLAGTISGLGALTKIGLGELVLAGAGNSYAGGTVIDAGTLFVATDNLLGNAAGGLTLDGGMLTVGGGFTSARAVTLEDGGGTLDVSNFSATFSGVISGPGGLTRAGSNATIVLTGDNTYAGGTTISNGVLQIGDIGGTTGSIFGDVLNNGGLTFGRSDVYAVVNTISGAGTVTIQNGGIATLTGSNNFTGDLRILGVSGSPPQGSTLIAEANSNLGSATGNIILEQGSSLVLAELDSISPAQSFSMARCRGP